MERLLTRGWALRVYGDPQPKGSMKCIGARGKVKHQLVEDNTDSDPWRTKIAVVAGRLLAEGKLERAAQYQPVEVELTATLPRPDSHYGTGKNRHTVKASAPVWPTTFGTGDVDKLARLVLDALEDVAVVHNDAQVIELHAFKCYPASTAAMARGWDVLDRPGVVVRVRPVG